MNAKALILAVLLPLPALAQGFAGLGQSVEGYALPERGRALDFPRDHGAHPAFRIEWWYLTANLTGPDGQDYGIQWTLFRNALAAGNPDPEAPAAQAWMGHAALTSPDGHHHAERLARGGTGQAGVTIEPFAAWIDDWRMESTAPPDRDPYSALTLTASGTDFAYDLTLTAEGPLVLHGDAGYSVKSVEGQASYYYSQPFYRVTGTLTLPAGPVEVTGQAWLDREWSSQPLTANQEGWDWISLHFEGGDKLMGYRMRGQPADYTVGTWIAADGTATPLPEGMLEMAPIRRAEVAGRDVPVGWRVTLPARGVDIELQAVQDASWMDTMIPYWEGPVRITGSHAGRGYLEMTGYD